MPRFEIPISRSSEMVDGKPVFWWVGAHSVDTEWQIFRSSDARLAIPRVEKSAESGGRPMPRISSALTFIMTLQQIRDELDAISREVYCQSFFGGNVTVDNILSNRGLQRLTDLRLALDREILKQAETAVAK